MPSCCSYLVNPVSSWLLYLVKLRIVDTITEALEFMGKTGYMEQAFTWLGDNMPLGGGHFVRLWDNPLCV